MKKLLLVLILAALSGFAGFRLVRARQAQAQTQAFAPYVITQEQRKVFDDGREQLEIKLTIYTASDGSMREVRTFIKADGTEDSATTEQLVKPGDGTYAIFHGAKVIRKLRDSSGPKQLPHISAEDLKREPGYTGTEPLPGGYIAYVQKVVDEQGTTELWRAPEFGMPLLGYRFRAAAGDYTTVRRTLSITPGKDSNVAVNYAGYEWPSP